MSFNWEKWERTRKLGLVRFVLLYGILLYGTVVFFVLLGLAVILRIDQTITEHITRALFLGLVFGIYYYLTTESKYKKHIKDKS
ncbi:putative membrane protein [Bacillus mesophilus]|uniref:Uncharacterized protein n=1 Tax=Bacillus mesophilus TaxID=1808955 RepID=A0A6M0QB00_9BACI|nr:hypothetical protein [Bacillus mesophilus]MBM7662893.1 putative membrane protein [Bacillus mesophilus]NEY73482.1 hypothetical protein [Bacillus mesophilus]